MRFDPARDFFDDCATSTSATSAPHEATRAPRTDESATSAPRAPHPTRAPRGAATLVDFVRAICDADHDPDCYCRACDEVRLARENMRWATIKG
jgi:hypothetical protein